MTIPPREDWQETLGIRVVPAPWMPPDEMFIFNRPRIEMKSCRIVDSRIICEFRFVDKPTGFSMKLEP